MRSLAGGLPKQASQHRRQVCHQLTQGRRPGRKRSGGAHRNSLASFERRQDGAERPETPWRRNPPAESQPSVQPIWLGRVNGYATLCAAFRPDDRRPAPATSRRVNFEQTAGPETGENPALGRVRAGDLQLDFRPAGQRASLLANHAGPLATSRGGDSCHPTLGEPATSCRTQLDDEASRLPARVGSAPRDRLAAISRRNSRLVVPANGSHQLRGG